MGGVAPNKAPADTQNIEEKKVNLVEKSPVPSGKLSECPRQSVRFIIRDHFVAKIVLWWFFFPSE